MAELQSTWPKNWGHRDENAIGIVTPYYDQVNYLFCIFENISEKLKKILKTGEIGMKMLLVLSHPIMTRYFLMFTTYFPKSIFIRYLFVFILLISFYLITFF